MSSLCYSDVVSLLDEKVEGSYLVLLRKISCGISSLKSTWPYVSSVLGFNHMKISFSESSLHLLLNLFCLDLHSRSFSFLYVFRELIRTSASLTAC